MSESIADHDDELMEKYLMEEAIREDEINSTIRKATMVREITSVLCGTALKYASAQIFIDRVIDYLPSARDVDAISGVDPKDDSVKLTRKPDVNEPFSALAFKIMTDPYVGKLTFFRVYSGQLEKGSYILNSTTGDRERVGRILEM